jgi:polyribonucleotide nucleotidyltransferase
MQYFFPPFSVGEVGRVGPPGRREVGHGKLADRALVATLPTKEEFPYIIRLESNITESNGSSSMASVCGGCLALMDAGVPIKRPVSGIAMGLLLEENHCVILSDILGVEDALGDMDFKVTGDETGITAFQMDIKVEGITIDIMRKALAQAKQGRLHILKKMLEVSPLKPMSIYAPRIETMQVKPSKIGLVIGPGGKQIRSIIEETGVSIDINDDGCVSLASSSAESLEKAKRIIHGLTAEAEIGKTYSGKIASIVQFGFFVEILPGKEGLCHISEIDVQRIEKIEDYVKQHNIKVGDPFEVIVSDINDRGQLKLSHKALLHKHARAPQA